MMGIEKDKKCKRLNFEIRIPTSAIKKMSYTLTLREKALIFGWKNNNDVVNAWWSLNKGIESTYMIESPLH